MESDASRTDHWHLVYGPGLHWHHEHLGHHAQYLHNRLTLIHHNIIVNVIKNIISIKNSSSQVSSVTRMRYYQHRRQLYDSYYSALHFFWESGTMIRSASCERSWPEQRNSFLTCYFHSISVCKIFTVEIKRTKVMMNTHQDSDRIVSHKYAFNIGSLPTIRSRDQAWKVRQYGTSPTNVTIRLFRLFLKTPNSLVSPYEPIAWSYYLPACHSVEVLAAYGILN